MLKKRIIFTLLYDRGSFMLSRNFRLQRVGGLDWLKKNYVFSRITLAIDELIVLDVSKGERNRYAFAECLAALTEECFIPIAAGGGVRSAEDARRLFSSGADKIVVNTALFSFPDEVRKIVSLYGGQAVIASLDAKRSGEGYEVRTENGERPMEWSLAESVRKGILLGVGEIYLNSIDRDGTGQGLDMELRNALPADISVPLILTGGAGKASHLLEGLRDEQVDAVATANLFNFVGDGLCRAREELLAEGVDLPRWEGATTESLRNLF